jgi:hypothetical protein
MDYVAIGQYQSLSYPLVIPLIIHTSVDVVYQSLSKISFTVNNTKVLSLATITVIITVIKC